MARGRKAAAVLDGPVEGPWDLPKGWRWERIEVVAPVNPRRKFDHLPDDAEIAFVPMAAVQELSGEIDVSEVRSVAAVQSGFSRFASGDVIFAKITPCMENGKLAVVPPVPYGMAAGSTEFHVLEPQGVSAGYLFHFLSQEIFRNAAEHNMTGTAGQKRVSADWLRNALIPVPPSRQAETEIILQLDQLLEEVEDAEAVMRDVSEATETYRRALLRAAVTGQLLFEDADEQPIETGQDLLKRILAAKRERWEANPRNIGKKYREPSGPEAADFPKLPDGWTWAALRQLADIGTGSTPSRKEPSYWTDGNIPWLTSSVVNSDQVTEAAQFVTSAGQSAARLKEYRPGALLVALYGEGRTRGKSTVLEIEATINQALAALAPVPEINVHWLKAVLDEGYERNRAGSAGGVQPNLNLEKIGGIAVPLGPASAMRVALERLSAGLKANEELRSKTFAHNPSSLRQSILVAAFRGHLTPESQT